MVLRKACLSSYNMVAIRDIAADFAKAVPEDDVPDTAMNVLYPALLYCDVIDAIQEAIEQSGEGFEIKSYWSGHVLKQRVEEFQRSLIGRELYLNALLEGVEYRMSKHFDRDLSEGDFALFKTSNGLSAGMYRLDDMYQTYHTPKDNVYSAERSPRLICKLMLIDHVSEGLPAVVAQAERWSVGFPQFSGDAVVMTEDLERQTFNSIYLRPYIMKGLFPVFRQEPTLKGPYR